MKGNIIVYRCSLVSAALLILAAIARGLSINNIIVASNVGDISRHYAASILIAWILSGLLLLMVAAWLLFLSADLKRFKRKAWMQAVLIATSISIFGAALWYRYPASVHLPVFLVTGLILLIPLLIYGRRFKD
jgi:hypothetical protein